MRTRDIIVIGASAGGVEALKLLVAGLPAALPATLLIAWHMAPEVTGMLPRVLTKAGPLPAENALDGQVFSPGRIYIAPPDRHLLIDNERLRVTRGPRENGFRPAVDPLFRSAAYFYGRRVIGVILSGALDDGTSGLWTVKHHGGLAVVQDPADAENPSMPRNAIRRVDVDHVVPAGEMAGLLARLSGEPRTGDSGTVIQSNVDQTLFEIQTAAEQKSTSDILKFGDPTPFTCPECRGVLFRLYDDDRPRFRCHTGHAFSPDSLLENVTENIEKDLWSAVRCIDESVLLLKQLGEHYSHKDQPNLAAKYFKKALEAAERGKNIRRTVFEHERLTADRLRELAGGEPPPTENDSL